MTEADLLHVPMGPYVLLDQGQLARNDPHAPRNAWLCEQVIPFGNPYMDSLDKPKLFRGMSFGQF